MLKPRIVRPEMYSWFGPIQRLKSCNGFCSLKTMCWSQVNYSISVRKNALWIIENDNALNSKKKEKQFTSLNDPGVRNS